MNSLYGVLSALLVRKLRISITTRTFVVVDYESKKSTPEDLWQFFQNGWEFFNQILCA